MSVQNLREKFSQSSNDAPTPPGTSYGTLKPSKIKQENSSPKFSPFTPNVENKSPVPFKLQTRKSVSPEKEPPSVNGTNGFKNCVIAKKNPEQCQQEIILRKWKQNSTVDKEAEKPKNSVSRYTAQLSLERNNSKDDVAVDNGSDRTEKLKSIYEPSAGSKSMNKINVGCNSNSNAFKPNSNFISSVKMNSDIATTENCHKVNLKPVSNGFKENDRWKSTAPVQDGEPKKANFQINSKSKFTVRYHKYTGD